MAHDRVGEGGVPRFTRNCWRKCWRAAQFVAAIAGNTAAAEIIAYRRASQKSFNRRRLEAASCECYEIVKTAYESIVMS